MELGLTAGLDIGPNVEPSAPDFDPWAGLASTLIPEAGPALSGRIRQIRTRARHPHGYRLYDYRPDLLVLADCVETVLGLHRPQPADPAGTALDTNAPWCHVCLHAWPCPTVGAISGVLDVD